MEERLIHAEGKGEVAEILYKWKAEGFGRKLKEHTSFKYQKLSFKLREAVLEGEPQTILKILIIIGFYSTTRAGPDMDSIYLIYHSGKTILGVDIFTFLWLTIFSSVFKSTWTRMKMLSEGKYQSAHTILGKMMLFIHVLSALFTKALCLVSFFTPLLGLFSTYGHWQQQQKLFSCDLVTKGNGTFRSADANGMLLFYIILSYFLQRKYSTFSQTVHSRILAQILDSILV